MTSVSKETGAAILKRLDFLYDQRAADLLTKIEQLLEKHRAKKVCPLHFLDVVVSHAQCKAMGRAWKSQFEGRGTRLLYLDDESYASDEAKPLPE